MQNAKSPEQLETYLRTVRENLRRLPESEASEVVQELRSHVLDRVAGDFTEASLAHALASLGDPREVARANMTRRVATQATLSGSPVIVAKKIIELARLSFGGFVTLSVSLIGYAFAGCWLLTAIAKPFAPDRFGLWSVADPSDDLSFSLGRRTAGLVEHDILGWWIIPIGLALALISAYLTFQFHQQAIRQMAHRKPDGVPYE